MDKQHIHLDYPLFIIVGILLIFGIVILSGVSVVFSQDKVGQTSYYLIHQMIYGIGIGLLLGFIVYKLPLKILKKLSWVFLLGNLFLMILVFIPGLSIISGGAPRWINIAGFAFQPSEFLKLSLILYIAVWLANRTSKSKLKGKKQWLTFLPFFSILVFIGFLLFLQSDASTSAIILAVGILMYFTANTPISHTLILGSAATAGLIAFVIFSSYRIERILVLLGITKDPMGMGYQIKQALITVGSGGLFGVGLGMSNQKFGGLLPQTMSDSIFAVFAEEAGFAGAATLIILFLLFVWRSFRIAKDSKDTFSRLFAIGLSTWICIQAFVNIGAMIGILPLTGIPLPFIGYGGSHVAVELIGVGILLNISKSNKK